MFCYIQKHLALPIQIQPSNVCNNSCNIKSGSYYDVYKREEEREKIRSVTREIRHLRTFWTKACNCTWLWEPLLIIQLYPPFPELKVMKSRMGFAVSKWIRKPSCSGLFKSNDIGIKVLKCKLIYQVKKRDKLF